jgi:signal transduction histidine kinase
MRQSLIRIIFLTSALVAAVLVVFAALLMWRDARSQAIAGGDRQAFAVAEVAAVTADGDLLRRAIARTDAGAQGRLAVHLPDGTVVGASQASPVQVSLATGHAGTSTSTAAVEGGVIDLRSIRAANGGTAVVEVYMSSEELTAGVGRRLAIVALVACAAVALAVFGGYLLTRPIVTSLRGLVSAAAAIGGGRKQTRTRIAEPAELAELDVLIDRGADRVEQLLRNEREFIADLSHRLRTPLTALRLDSEAIGGGQEAERIRHAVAALERDVDDLINTTEHTSRTTSTTCDAVALVRDRMAFWRVLAQHQARSCDFVCDTESAPIPLSPKDVGAVVDALVGNIFRHTKHTVPLAVTLVKHAGWVTLVVEDGGPGVGDPEGAVRRGSSGGGSTGLGLDIARHAVEATGGTIHIDRGRLGGARIRLRFAEAGAHHSHEEPRAWRLWSNTLAEPVNLLDASRGEPGNDAALEKEHHDHEWDRDDDTGGHLRTKG